MTEIKHANNPMPTLHLVLLIVFLFFSFNTTTRFIGGMLGPSEIAIGLLMVLTIVSWRQLPWHRGAAVLWIVFLCTLGLGWALSATTNPLASYNMLAYAYNCITSMFLLAYLMAQDDRSVARFVRCYVMVTTALIFIAGLAFLSNDFSMPHFKFRMPLVWFCFALICIIAYVRACDCVQKEHYE